ncbi:hypothetical protein FVF58_43150 [Paraburkholderia panacisoli]|uniref:Uncharacterized protein n=1 Tax=Paraburkholderia panacisoli TaxID=2603818 RepID=A0A5B0G5T5_9BURK|nr:hypothetical protein [Paraburkholderia panacisoli]KAA0998787.1 hypothetical protein FVF58_43150 [Paraburkholderia panacisoli]
MGILARLFHREGTSEKRAQDSAQVSEAIERIAKLTPQLRLAERYQERLAAAVSTSLDYVRALVDDMPPAREASASAWTTNPYIQAFFATPEDVPRVLSHSTELRTHFDANPLATEAFAVLGMAMTERRTFGVAQHGSTACADVQRTTVSFSDHRARVCASTEQTLREEIVRRVVDQLVLVALERIGADVSRRGELEQERALLKTRLALLQRQGSGMSAVLGAEPLSSLVEVARLQAQMEKNDAEMARLGLATEAIDCRLKIIADVLNSPAEHLHVLKRELRLDRMNVIVENGYAHEGTTIELRLASVPETAGAMRAFALVKFTRSDLLPAPGMVDEERKCLI